MHSFDFDGLFFKYRYPLLILLVGLVLVGVGFFIFKSGFGGATKIEVLESGETNSDEETLVVEITGEVIKPGVYKLPGGSRIDDLLISSGGFSENADRVWSDKYLNRAAKLTDGQKVFIPTVNQQTVGVTAKSAGGDQTVSSNISSDSSGLININSASLSQLDKLSGIGPVYGQSIIDHRPYSTVEELLSKGVLKKSVYEKIKDSVSVY